MDYKLFSNRFVRAVFPYLIVICSLLSISGYASSLYHSKSFTTNPELILNGPNPQQIVLGNSYSELSATASDAEDGPLTDQILIFGVNAINTNIVGVYNVQYSITDADGNTTTLIRTVEVIDTTPPSINLNGNSIVSIEVGTTYNELGATASDNYDDDNTITSSIVTSGSVNTAALGSYTVSYDVSDSSSNAATTLTRTVNVIDTTKPILSLLGSTPVIIELGQAYSDAGASASDNYDDNTSISAAITTSGAVDNTAVGSYTLTYGVSDTSNNQANPISRTVVVEDNTSPVITLLGTSTITVEVGNSYIDPGVVGTDNYDNDSAITAAITSSGSVDTSTLGSYLVTYTVSDNSGNAATPVSRTVQVVDSTKPSINLFGDASMTISYQSSFVDPGATATDNYDNNITSSIQVTGSVNENILATYTLSYDVSDSSENDATTVTRQVTVADTTPPSITILGDETIYLAVGDSYSDAGATALDNYDLDITSAITQSGSVDTAVVGTYYIVYNATDSNGNSASQATRTVVVGTPPSISLQGDNPMTVEIGSSYNELGAIASDPEDGELTDDIDISGTVNTNVFGTYQIQYIVTDSNSNTTIVTRTVQVVDTTNPSITLIGGEEITVEVGGSFVDPGATATDTHEGNISSAIVVTGSVDTDALGTYVIRYNVSDSSGNAATEVTRTITVKDTTPPDFSLVGNATVSIEINTSFVDPGASAIDVNDGDISSSVNVIGTVDTSVVGSTTLYYNILDSSGNAASQLDRTVQVVESTPPVITLGGNSSVSLEVLSTYTDAGATALDNYDDDITSSIVLTGNVDHTTVGTYMLRYNVSDSSGNAATEVVRTVVVEDTTDPVITLVGDASISLEVGDSFTDLGVTAEDNYDGSLTGAVTTTGTVDTSAAGTYLITYNVSDAQGNAADPVVRTVVVGTPPSISLQGNNPLTIQYNETYTELGATATDVEDGAITNITTSGTVNSSILGTYTVQYSVTDSSGATTVVERTVNVVDTIVPVITLAGNASENVAVGSSYADPGATAADNYDGDISNIISTTGSVDSSTVGAYTITYDVIDSQGNSAITETRTVNVVDEVAPTISLFGQANINLKCMIHIPKVAQAQLTIMRVIFLVR
ncbi:MAG: beta strand repeat-containing protein [Flavobacteriaceae bacterium]